MVNISTLYVNCIYLVGDIWGLQKYLEDIAPPRAALYLNSPLPPVWATIIRYLWTMSLPSASWQPRPRPCAHLSTPVHELSKQNVHDNLTEVLTAKLYECRKVFSYVSFSVLLLSTVCKYLILVRVHCCIQGLLRANSWNPRISFWLAGWICLPSEVLASMSAVTPPFGGQTAWN